MPLYGQRLYKEFSSRDIYSEQARRTHTNRFFQHKRKSQSQYTYTDSSVNMYANVVPVLEVSK